MSPKPNADVIVFTIHDFVKTNCGSEVMPLRLENKALVSSSRFIKFLGVSAWDQMVRVALLTSNTIADFGKFGSITNHLAFLIFPGYSYWVCLSGGGAIKFINNPI